MISSADQRKIIDLIDDDLYKMAGDFLNDAYNTFSRKMSTSQIKGIENVFYSSYSLYELSQFLRHQKTKADKKGYHGADEAKFFNDFDQQIKNKLDKILKDHFPHITDKNEKEAVKRELASGYIQHLVAHHYYSSSR